MDEKCLYFHGIPGGPGELQLFGDAFAHRLSAVRVVDRAMTSPGGGDEAYFSLIAQTIKAQYPGMPLRLIGFSLGASTALRIAPYLGPQVVAIDLISAAAPLALGDYLATMAGAPVFRLAQSRPLLFGMVARLQSIAARMAPGKLYDALFASAQGEDRALRDDPAFKAAMLPVLRQSLGNGLPTYCNEIALYTQGWQTGLDHVTQPVSLYHGSRDNWSPVAMAEDLARCLPQVRSFHVFDGLSHYSALRAYWSDHFTQPSPIVS